MLRAPLFRSIVFQNREPSGEKKFSRSLTKRGDEGDTKGNKEKIEWQ